MNEFGNFSCKMADIFSWPYFVKMAVRHFGPLTEPQTTSQTCWHIPPNLTYGHRYPKYIIFSVKSTNFSIFHYWGCVSPHLWRTSWPLAPRLVVTLRNLITPSHIYQSWLCHFKNSCDVGTICLQLAKMCLYLTMLCNLDDAYKWEPLYEL